MDSGHRLPARALELDLVELLAEADIADGILYAVSRPPRIAVNEVLIRPSSQSR